MHTSTLYLNEQVVSFAEEVAAISGIPDARDYAVWSLSLSIETESQPNIGYDTQ